MTDDERIRAEHSSGPQGCELCLLARACDRLERERDEARSIAAEAIDEIESWGAYASDYFQEKWDLAGTVERLRAALRALRDRERQSAEPPPVRGGKET